MPVEAGLALRGEDFLPMFRKTIIPDRGGSADVVLEQVGNIAHVLHPGSYLLDLGVQIVVSTVDPKASYQIDLGLGKHAEVFVQLPIFIHGADGNNIPVGDAIVLRVERTAE